MNLQKKLLLEMYHILGNRNLRKDIDNLSNVYQSIIKFNR